MPFIVSMAKPMVLAMFGQVEALGYSLQSAERRRWRASTYQRARAAS